jgi:peptide/nickel transport system ATP-binding protein
MSTPVETVEAGGAVVPAVEVRDLRIGAIRRGRADSDDEIVHGISFTIDAGRCVALVGESGAGKSITARALLDLSGEGTAVTAAVLRVLGDDVLDYSSAQWRQLRGGRAGLILQDALTSLDPLQTLHSAISEVLRQHNTVPRSAVDARVVELLELVGIPDAAARAQQRPGQLSGGLRQRALIATAIAADPGLIIADEPTTALDVTVQRQVLDVLAERKAAGTALLLVSHDLAVVAEIADEVLVLKDGRVVERGTPQQVLASPQHPYTRKLIAAIPTAASRGSRLAVAENAVVTERVALPSRAIGERVVIEAAGLVKSYALPGAAQSFRAVDDVSFALHRGETVGLVGESGSGKSTVGRIVLGLTGADSGTVELDGEAWSSLPERRRRARRRSLQLVSQDPLSSFDPRYSAARVVAEALPPELSGAQRTARIAELFDRVSLAPSLAQRSPSRLSGGQRQRLAIARALAADPIAIVCDEAVSALDVSIQAQILDLLADIQAESHLALLFISHDLGVIHHIADRVLVMEKGRVVESGDAAEVFDDPQAPYTRRLLADVPRGLELAPAL